MARARSAITAWLAIGMVACSPSPTQLIVVVDTNLPVPQDIDAIEVSASAMGRGAPEVERAVLRGIEDLPRSVAVIPSGEFLGPVEIIARGLRGPQTVVTRTHRTTLVRGESRLLRLLLDADCVDTSCAASETCGESGCTPIDVSFASLPPYDGQIPGRMDQTDASTPVVDRDAGGPGSEFDAGPRDGGSPDSGRPDAGRPDAGPPCSPGSCGAGLTCCETCVNLNRAPRDCGMCGRACDFFEGVAGCQAGACRLLDCHAGYGNCDGADGNGCEQALDSPAHCGGCGVTCTRDHASPDCGGGSCRIGTCDPGWGDCDGIDANGCEQRLETLDHCGACGFRCATLNTDSVCEAGRCEVVSCDLDWDDCDRDPLNGCETDLNSPFDCGSCRNRCSLPGAVTDCDLGSCHFVECLPNNGNCDGNESNGCETTLTSEAACGACGNACGPGEFCLGGGCTCGLISAGSGPACTDGTTCTGVTCE